MSKYFGEDWGEKAAYTLGEQLWKRSRKGAEMTSVGRCLQMACSEEGSVAGPRPEPRWAEAREVERQAESHGRDTQRASQAHTQPRDVRHWARACTFCLALQGHRAEQRSQQEDPRGQGWRGQSCKSPESSSQLIDILKVFMILFPKLVTGSIFWKSIKGKNKVTSKHVFTHINKLQTHTTFILWEILLDKVTEWLSC